MDGSSLSTKRTVERINNAENKFRNRIEEVANHILSHGNVRFLTLSGPSCSGKTTTAAILRERITGAGRNVTIISIDDFYRDRDDIIADCKARDIPLDMDSITSIDLDELSRFVTSIRAGKRALLPRFDFVTGKRIGYKMLWPDSGAVYLLEGIQAVYPEVTALFGHEEVLRLYISIETGIENESGVWSPREIRLMRRLLRDSIYRGADASDTFAHWGGVVRNELQNIEPYKDICDEKIDSGMEYELNVMRDPIIELLSEVGDGDDHAVLAVLLKEKLSMIDSIPKNLVPQDSMLREFVGE